MTSCNVKGFLVFSIPLRVNTQSLAISCFQSLLLIVLVRPNGQSLSAHKSITITLFGCKGALKEWQGIALLIGEAP